MKHDKKKQWLSIGLLTLGAAALAIFAAATLDAGDVRASLEALMPGWTAAIVGCMLLYYLCDALKYRLITRAFGCAQPLGDSIDVSMVGFFYSAVTPAAAGGQPFQVLHMHRRGIPTGTATSVICTVYSLWNIALVSLGIVGACLCGGKLAAQSAAWIPVLALGLFVHAGLLSLVLLSAIFPKPMSAFGTACIRWLYRRRPFVRRGADPAAAAEKWCAFVAEYHDAFAAGIRHRGKLAGALALALLQCTAYMSVAYCTYRGFGLRGVPFWQVTGTQVLLYIGASCFPMPGASGASEGTFYLAFSPLFGSYDDRHAHLAAGVVLSHDRTWLHRRRGRARDAAPRGNVKAHKIRTRDRLRKRPSRRSITQRTPQKTALAAQVRFWFAQPP